MSGIIVLGALHRDIVVDAPRVPRLDETLPGTGVDYRVGGKGGNQALAAARMGAQVAMAGRVGRDSAAMTIRAGLDEAGVAHSLVLDTTSATGISVAITIPSGEYCAVTVPGANLANDGFVTWLEPPVVALLQNEIPEAANLAFASSLPPGCTLIVNSAPGRRIPSILAERIDVLVVNRVEAECLTGCRNPEDAVKALAGSMRCAIVLTRGADGVTWQENGQMTHQAAYSMEVVSAHGAGDMFTGSLAARLAAGHSLRSSLRFAQAAAGLFVSSPVDRRREVTRTAVETFLARGQA